MAFQLGRAMRDNVSHDCQEITGESTPPLMRLSTTPVARFTERLITYLSPKTYLTTHLRPKTCLILKICIKTCHKSILLVN